MKINAIKKTLLGILSVYLMFNFSSCSSDDNTTEETTVTDESEGEEIELVDGTTIDETTLGFAKGNVEVTFVEIDGVEYYQIDTSNQTSLPVNHEMGPWCPYDIEDDTAEEGGIWLDDGVLYNITYDFLDTTVNELYTEEEGFDGDLWDEIIDGDNVNYTETQEECILAANPNVDPDLWSHCVECLPSFFEDEFIENVYYLPVNPVKLDTPQNISGTHGISFNGVIYEAEAPVADIISAYTIAAFDNAGGHINPYEGYHYHTSTSMTLSEEQEDGHADKIGYALDGFELYDYDDSILNDLDDCQGHEDDARGYHYHVSAPGTLMFLPCFYGQELSSGTEGGQGGPPMP